ncbi:MAG: 3-isopropylmalate dehydrogenase [Acidobacteria bacterium]|nr:3-isopropylmalate dehydrogenase [Acidobacteriota bacterium]
MKLKITALPGDGIGPEVVREAIKVLRVVADKFNHEVEIGEHAIGGNAVEAFGSPLPEATIAACLSSKAVLLGAVGGPQYDKNPRGLKPEDGLLGLRKALQAFANLRPVIVYDELIEASPLKADIVKGCDLLIVRELLGGLYFATPRGFDEENGQWTRGFNTMSYDVAEIERIAHVAFKAAEKRRGLVASVDKANVLETSQLWRQVVERVAKDYPHIKLEHILVDNCAMQLVREPRRFDVILTENMFGDILSDEAAVISGSIGMLASASLGGPVGLYEPIHGSAPDIAGQGKANPLGTIASVALMLRYSFELEAEAHAVEKAIDAALAEGLRTADLAAGGAYISTTQMGDAVCEGITGKWSTATE